jgi:hypothetical protein
LTVDPGATNVLDAGFELMMLPAGTAGLLVVDTVPTTSPAFVNAVSASARVKPVKSGTGTSGMGPPRRLGHRCSFQGAALFS